MEPDQESDVGSWLQAQHVQEHEDIVVYGDKAEYSYEVRIYQPAAVHHFEILSQL